MNADTRSSVASVIAREMPEPIYLAPGSKVVTGYFYPSYEEMERELDSQGFFDDLNAGFVDEAISPTSETVRGCAEARSEKKAGGR